MKKIAFLVSTASGKTFLIGQWLKNVNRYVRFDALNLQKGRINNACKEGSKKETTKEGKEGGEKEGNQKAST
jgi:hypothetical protein